MSFEFRPATRESIWLLIGLSGGTGSGKTYSGMRLAEGLSGGKSFAVIDTEAGRAKHYAEQFQFDHGDLKPPFMPEAYLEAILAAEKASYEVILVDSMSHEWAGEGGILDLQEAELTRMAGNDPARRESCKMASWIKPKASHKKMMARLLQLRAHLILCFRAESKIEMAKNRDTGKMEVRAKQALTGLDGWIPIAEKNLPYELTTSFLLMADRPGIPLPIKLQEQHKPFFDLSQPLTTEAGRKLGEWARGGVSISNGAFINREAASKLLADFKAELKPQYANDAKAYLKGWLYSNGILDEKGQPSLFAIRTENYAVVKEAAIAFAKEMTS